MPPPTFEQIVAAPPESFIKLLEVRIDPVKSLNTEKTIAFHFTDLKKTFGLAVRRGVAKFLGEHDGKMDVTLDLTRDTWARMVSGETTLPKAIIDGKVAVKGSTEDATQVFEAFNVGTGEGPRPAALHD